MDADTLRAILSAQAAAQAAAQEKMLQAVMKEMRGLFSTMASSPTTAHATSAEFVTNSLSARLPEFTHDPENGCTFDVWYSCYEDIITQDGATLDDAARARLIVSKLDAAAYARFTNHILPRRAAEIPLADTVKTLQELFGHNTSVFARRYAYLKTQCNGESLRDYTGLVNRRHEMAEFNAITAEQMKCLVWICGLAAPEYADIRTHALRKLESNPETTLRELSTEIQQVLDIRQDAKLLGSPPSPAVPLSEVNAVNVKKSYSKEPPSPCFRCGGPHWAKECDFMEKRCHACNRVGHKKGFCKNFNRRRTPNLKRKRKKANQVVIAASTTADIGPIKRIYRTVEINGASTRMRLDTGADVTLLSCKDWTAMGRPRLLPPLFTLKCANGKKINVRGQFNCIFTIDGRQGRGTCHVADTSSLLGLDWIAQVEPLFHRLIGSITCSAISGSTLSAVRTSLTARLQKQFPAVFAPGLGCCTKSKAFLKLKPDATPVFRKARPVPYAVQPRITQELDRLVTANVLTPVEHSEWAAPVVVVQKKNGTIRLCADFSTGLNDALEQHQHPLPTPDDIFTKLNGGRYFSQLDLAEAYLQMEVDEESRPLLTINTHRGLYRLNRLPFGVKAAPAIFQQQMDTLTAGLDGLVNFYGTFVRELHNLRAPLDALTKKDAAYIWSPDCQSCFDRIKKTLKSDLLLAHYDPTLPLIVAADASNYGVGAVLSQRFPDGSEKAVYHASRALTPAQKKYSQIEKEALAIVFAVQKFHRFVHGRHFTLRTDHKPLISIFGSRKGIPIYTANRLQRPNEDEDVGSQLCVLAVDGYRYRHSRQELCYLCPAC
ncbi:zinc knuckle [Teladorsagia circumcincta]|uniref:RNA-directed DNA polymerase n=1 Tax=Teladorsagia circumcincta TaxID=45464 RepID=A0A2G9UQ22_TELCI|nr:zinc knuckle [Teladorsagia circumcincta]